MQTLSSAATVIITRPPDIIACTKIKGSGMDVFLIFDSHPHPWIYPSGVGLILSTSIDKAATRLASILSTADDYLLSQSGLQWQAPIINDVSGHVFVSNVPPGGMGDIQQSVIESQLAVLRLQAEVAGLKQQNARLTSENETLEGDVQHLKDALSVERTKVTSLQASSEITQSRNVQPISARPTNAIAEPSWLARHFLRRKSGSQSQRHYSSPPPSVPWHDGLSGIPWEAESLSAALELQRSFDVEDMQLREQMQALTSKTPLNFSCTICMEEQPVDNSVELDCNHAICRACVRGHVCSKIEEHRFPILCPVCMTEQNNCRPGGKWYMVCSAHY